MRKTDNTKEPKEIIDIFGEIKWEILPENVNMDKGKVSLTA